MILSIKAKLSDKVFRAMSRLCGPRTKVKRGVWVAEAIAEKVERETANTSVKVDEK